MPNNYYNNSSPLVGGLRARSDQINTDRDAVEAAFDLLPPNADDIALSLASYGSASSSGNHDVIAVTMPVTRASNDTGSLVVFKAFGTNAVSPVYLDIDGLGNVELKKMVAGTATAVGVGEIAQNYIYSARYTGSVWQLMNPV